MHNRYIIEKKQPLHGIWRILPSVSLTEIIAQSGFDFQILDCEHGGYDYDTLLKDIIASQLHNSSPFVRVSGINKVEVQRCLDLGAHGIVFPQLNSYDDFKIAAELMEYAPRGIRGFNPFVRVGGYGIGDKPANPVKPICIAIIETLQAVNELETIVTIDGIDMFYIGSYDLSAQLGCIGEMNSPILIDVVDRIISVCSNAGKRVSLMIHDKVQFEATAAKGVSVFVHAVDSYKIKSFFFKGLTEIKNS